MLALGIEGTAHTVGVGIVEEREPFRSLTVRANERAMVQPAEGGIHPREAADHHAERIADLFSAALEEAGVVARELDIVAFSQGPGLGPCLRTVATAARTLSLSLDKPLVGVNHCVAHLEIGRAMADCADPMLLYTSGANTQVIAHSTGRYRVFGETLDVGLGNALDKFARNQGIAFPGGPEIEKIAKGGDQLLPLPYSVKGMDVAFSGLVTAAEQHLANGSPLEDVCHSLQEWAFAMVVEVTERAMAHAGKSEVLLGGGVACNARLQEMARMMAEDRGATFHCPPRHVLIDNGAMIAWNGILHHRSGQDVTLAGSQVDQRYRTDQVDVAWWDQVTKRVAPPKPGLHAMGAEAEIARGEFHGRPVFLKRRVAKRYRHPEIDRLIRGMRTKVEGKLLVEARRSGIPTPVVLDADIHDATLVLTEAPGALLKEALENGHDAPDAARRLMQTVGRHVAALHAAGIVHGDLTGSNILVDGGSDLATKPVVHLIDFGLAGWSDDPEDLGVDLHVMEEALVSTHANRPELYRWALEGYKDAVKDWPAVEAKLREIEARGRYRSMLGS